MRYALVVLVKGDAEQVYIIDPKTLSNLSAIRNSVKERIKKQDGELSPKDVRIQIVPVAQGTFKGEEVEALIAAITDQWA